MTIYIYFPSPLGRVRLPDADGSLNETTRETLAEYAKQLRSQIDKCNDLNSKLTAAIGACTTLKRAKEALPEFEKYLPEDRETTGVGNLPAIANLVTDLMHLGWPKNKEQTA